MPGPWEDFQTQIPSAGPWNDFKTAETPAPELTSADKIRNFLMRGTTAGPGHYGDWESSHRFEFPPWLEKGGGAVIAAEGLPALIKAAPAIVRGIPSAVGTVAKAIVSPRKTAQQFAESIEPFLRDTESWPIPPWKPNIQPGTYKPPAATPKAPSKPTMKAPPAPPQAEWKPNWTDAEATIEPEIPKGPASLDELTYALTGGKVKTFTKASADQQAKIISAHNAVTATASKGLPAPQPMVGGRPVHVDETGVPVMYADTPEATAVQEASPVSKPSTEPLPAPNKPLHTEADTIQNFSTKRKVLNLTRHFMDEGKTWKELNDLHEAAKNTGNWNAIRELEQKAYQTGKELEQAGKAQKGTFVPGTKYKPPSASKAASEAGWVSPNQTESTWELLLQGYPGAPGLPAPRPQ